MSLLMQALKQAEDAKRRANEPAVDGLEPHSGLDASSGTDPFAAATAGPGLTPPRPTPTDTGKPHEMELVFRPPADTDAGAAGRAEPGMSSADGNAPPLEPAGFWSSPHEAPAHNHGARQAEPALQLDPYPIGQTPKELAAAQEKAKAVFAAKQAPRNRRIWLMSGVGGTILLLVGGLGYLQVQTTFVGPKQVVARPPSPQTAERLQAEAAPGAMAARGASTGAASLPAPVAPALGDTAPAPAAAPLPREQKVQAPPARDQHAIHFRQGGASAPVDPSLQNAYLAFVAGDAQAARQQYQNVLKRDANNRDALLGMAIIALQRKDSGQATSFYLKLLELDPTDPDAIAGLSSLQQVDPVQNESHLKQILARHPQSGAVLFAMGNLYAQQSRWADAQQAYFRAFTNAPANPDYAMNLAVSLDRLGQGKLALEYYQRALALGQASPGNFSTGGVETRIRELQSGGGG
jgi:Flp pilus assembly protein TadD